MRELVLAPLKGAAFALFLPFIGFVLLAHALGQAAMRLAWRRRRREWNEVEDGD